MTVIAGIPLLSIKRLGEQWNGFFNTTRAILWSYNIFNSIAALFIYDFSTATTTETLHIVWYIIMCLGTILITPWYSIKIVLDDYRREKKLIRDKPIIRTGKKEFREKLDRSSKESEPQEPTFGELLARFAENVRKRSLKGLIITFSPLLILVSLIIFLFSIQDSIKSTLLSLPARIIYGIIIFSIIITLFIRFIKLLFIYLSDSSKLKKVIFVNSVSRAEIHTNFMHFRSPSVRLKYIQMIENQKLAVTGNWPEGDLPNVNNDDASTLLAQLEEKWLGLDR
jgi:hypothetical protein